MLASPLRRWSRRGLALTCSLLAGLLVGEALVRLVSPPVLRAAAPLARLSPNHPYHPDAGRYLLDAELGYRPNPDHPDFHPSGCLAHDYPDEPTPGVRRLLLLGDSVVERGHLSRALAAALGPAWEVWSLGVSGYSTPEEVGLFEGVVGDVQPDTLLLLFSHNDLSRTPMRFIDGEGRLVLDFGERPWGLPASWVRRSRLMQLALSLEARRDPLDADQHRARVRRALERLTQACGERDLPLFAAIQPLIAPSREALEDPAFAHLRDVAEARHRANIAMFAELDLPATDLQPDIDGALERGDPTGELPGDVHHPSPTLARRYAARLARVLGDSP